MGKYVVRIQKRTQEIICRGSRSRSLRQEEFRNFTLLFFAGGQRHEQNIITHTHSNCLRIKPFACRSCLPFPSWFSWALSARCV